MVFRFESIDVIRLGIAIIAVLIVPGALVLSRVRTLAFWPERVVLSVAGSYALLVPTCTIVMTFGLSIRGAAVTLAALTAAAVVSLGIAGRPARRSQLMPAASDLLPLGVAAALGVIAWWLEPSIDGEELFELIIVRKILTNAHVTFSNVMHRPDAVYTYVLAPYPLLVALISDLATVSPYVAYAKLRPLYVAVSVLATYALTRRVSGTRVAAQCAAVGLGALILFDPDPWFWPASLFPLVRRGSFAAGVLVPAAMLMVLWSVRSRRRVVPLGLLAGLVLAALFTHALTSVFILWWAAGLMLAALLARRRVWRHAAALAVVVIALVAFRAITARFAPHVTEYLSGGRAATEARIATLIADRDWRGLLSQSPDGVYFLATSAAVTVYAVFPFVFLTITVAAGVPSSRTLLAASVPILLLYTTTLTLALLQLATIDEIIFAAGYFAIVGWIAWSVLLTSAAQRTLRWWHSRLGSPRVWVVVPAALAVGWFVLAPVCFAVMQAWVRHSALAPWVIAALWAVAAWLRGGLTLAQSPRSGQAGAVVAVAVSLAIPGFVQLKTFPGSISGSDRSTLLTQLQRRWSAPRPSEWPAYYENRRQTPTAITDIPIDRLNDLSRVLPRDAVVMYDPRYSFNLPAVLDVYIVNPGVRVSTDLLYDTTCIDRTGPEPIHALFNASAILSARERGCLKALGVTHVISNPAYRDAVASKLAGVPGVRTVYDRNGFTVFAVSK